MSQAYSYLQFCSNVFTVLRVGLVCESRYKVSKICILITPDGPTINLNSPEYRAITYFKEYLVTALNADVMILAHALHRKSLITQSGVGDTVQVIGLGSCRKASRIIEG